LIKDHIVIGDTRTNLVRSGLGMSVRAGKSKPGIGSVEEFKRVILAAKPIGYLKTPAGVHLDGVFARRGIAETVKRKAVRPDTDIVSELVAKGEMHGINVTTQILTTPGVELVGRLPEDIQYYVAFVGGIRTNSKAQNAARDLLQFLTGLAAIPVIKCQGMEPG
jgi:molybdate transport system substrate-binding protein